MQRIANILRRLPWVAVFATNLYRLTRPRYTAGVVGLVFNAAGELLLVEHVFHARHPWGLPGGWVDHTGSLEENLQREMQEELMLNVDVLQPVFIEIVPEHPSHIDIAYLCTAHNHVGRLSSELLRYRWTPLDDLPDVPRFHARAIQRVMQLQRMNNP